jgi:hypothetical protein
MTLHRVFDKIPHKKVVFRRQDGVIKRITRRVDIALDAPVINRPLFPINKERK